MNSPVPSLRVTKATVASLDIPDKLKKCPQIIEYVRGRVKEVDDMTDEQFAQFGQKISEAWSEWIVALKEAEKKAKSVEEYFQACTKRTIKFNMFWPKFFRTKNVRNKWILKSLISVWIYRWWNSTTPYNKKYNEEFSEWDNKDIAPYIYDEENEDRTIKSHETNYKSWLWEKLHLTWEEIQKLTIEQLDEKANKLLDNAIDHILKYFQENMIGSKLWEKSFKSSYFDKIHSKWENQKTFFELLNLYFVLEKDRIQALKANVKNTDLIKDITIAQFEIQRLFGLAILYNNRDKNHEFENLSQDKEFITWKLKNLLVEDCTIGLRKPEKSNIKDDECPNTVKTMFYITRTSEWTYTVSTDKPSSGEYIVKTLNSAVIRWKTDYFKKNPELIWIKHIMLRTAKDPQSSVDKILIRWLSSFSQIMDHKWIVIVLDSYDNVDKLEELLVNELWTRETSWAEEFRFPWKLNRQTSSSYKVKKWILLVPYKASFFKQKIEELEIHLKNLTEEMKDYCCENPEMDKAIKAIKRTIRYLKTRIKKWNYNLKVEIQVFDIQNYIKAEIDPASPAYHWTYKNNQRNLDVWPILFPSEIYWEEALREFMIPIIEKKYDIEWWEL